MYLRTYNQTKDATGAMIGNVYNVVSSSNLQPIADSAISQVAVSKFMVTFGEDMSTQGGATRAHSILNPNNWVISLNNNVLSGGVASVQYGWNQADDKFEAVVTFDADQGTAGNQPLGIGNYTLTIKDSVYDQFSNKLDGDYNGVPGVNFVRPFSVYGNGPVAGQPSNPVVPGGLTVVGTPDPNDTTIQDILVNTTDAWNMPDTGAEDSPKTAANANGDYVVVWVSKSSDATGNVMAQRFDRFGRMLGREIQVSSYENQAANLGQSGGPQLQPAVAMDVYGNFIVTWSGQGASDSAGIYARAFDTYGNPIGDDFRVNQTLRASRSSPAVAINSNGNVVFTWTTTGQGR